MLLATHPLEIPREHHDYENFHDTIDNLNLRLEELKKMNANFDLAAHIRNMSPEDFTQFQLALKEKEDDVKKKMGIAALVKANPQFEVFSEALSTMEGSFNSFFGRYCPNSFIFDGKQWTFSASLVIPTFRLYSPMGNSDLDIWITKTKKGEPLVKTSSDFEPSSALLSFFDLLCQYTWKLKMKN